MAILNFQKPDKVIMIDSSEFEANLNFDHLEPGYGLTVGNALRRVLLSSLEGFAITSVKIENIEHEFSTIPEIVKMLLKSFLTLKQVRFKRQIEDVEDEKVTIMVRRSRSIKAADFQKFIWISSIETDLVICNLEKGVQLNIEVTIEKGRGYVPAEENKKANAAFGVIAIDSIFTPVKNVKYSIENYRVEQKTDYEKLVFEIITDGSIHPKDALNRSCQDIDSPLLVVL